ncbi:hypothetical protein [Flavobacterium sp. CFS9]
MKNSNSVLKNGKKQLISEKTKFSANAKNVLFAVLFVFTAKTGYTQSNLSQLYQDKNGNIGIGTTIPDSKLHILGSNIPTGQGQQNFPFTAEAYIPGFDWTVGYRFGLGLVTGSNNRTSSQIQIIDQNKKIETLSEKNEALSKKNDVLSKR